MNTFTFTDDEVADINTALRRYSFDVEPHLKKSDDLGVDDLLIIRIRSAVPLTRDIIEKLKSHKEK